MAGKNGRNDIWTETFWLLMLKIIVNKNSGGRRYIKPFVSILLPSADYALCDVDVLHTQGKQWLETETWDIPVTIIRSIRKLQDCSQNFFNNR